MRSQQRDREPGPDLLTPRQLEVLELVAKGLTNREIAGVLGIATGTAKLHVAAVIEALDVSNRTEAAMVLRELNVAGDGSEGVPFPGFGGRQAIAVLPFTNLGGEPEHEAFAEGLAEDLITMLASWRWFPVIARNSTAAYAGRAVDVAQVARELGARYVIEGSSRRHGDRVRINLQLIDGADGTHVFAERFDRRVEDVFAVQDELTEAIFGVLEPALVRVEGLRAVRAIESSLGVWEAFHRGSHLLQTSVPADLAEAVGWFERALETDPDFAPGHAGIATAHFLESTYEVLGGLSGAGTPPAERVQAAITRMASALRSAERAVRLDPMDWSGHGILGALRAVLGNPDQGSASLERALELNPSSALCCYFLGAARLKAGDAERAIQVFERATRLSPRDPMLSQFLGALANAYLLSGAIPEAVEAARRSVEVEPPDTVSYLPTLAAALALAERDEEARDAMRRVFEIWPDWDNGFGRLFAPPELIDLFNAAYARFGFELA